VKVPIGKRCGFVQFVRKVDAQKAIEKMQVFPIGGSRIRLSWGKSQCEWFPFFVLCEGYGTDWTGCTDKAAVAQIQETQLQSPPVPGNANANATGVGVGGMRMTHDEALALLQKLQTGFTPPPNGYSAPSTAASANVDSVVGSIGS
jgi:RNA recognition motif-containing protein